ncbi:acyl-CoA dehydrogenase [Sphingomonas sp. ABOLG]|jgi:alkylation response protein AidB-like acyl-CoA dehydrogenase|uniref:Acyl-CoA dehydrogenase n=1 Tax=Sphingomonas olei TaxID=1886787 RepID=A0ABY2QL78_9SPHN|nr:MULTISPECIES: acyl-CoA dehydrogenase family protein [Sphingomonas]MDF2983685.1 acyl-CoA dehydrogenase [Devosia sp.]KKI17524.1 acyl-CoA dehydrogenase [Sphingomonas sp. Ag1]MDF2603559.1 acyl-CoA dehydrogenase [Sphingomonas sp.]RSV18747.1 acyl-CoA dehydrogenase [Sphingomonas sp. ABOLG]THG40467.1 acyl-CoA dehydrogenase [Sphingomonas olei]
MASAAELDRSADTIDAFRAEARAWLEANFPQSLRGKDNAMSAVDGPTEETAEQKAWREAMGAKGWGTPTWPKEYGGGGLTREQARVLGEEMARIGAWNPIGGMGVMMFGPTLLEYGSEEQKQKHIPGIVRGEVRWCQGYSEPGAGSDLASLQTFAEDKGDHYIVNGQKTWTSGGQWADKCFALVRTDKTQKHAGISFLLIDMDAEGVETRPIKLISGASPFCETFFTNVKVPKENLVGQEGQGWTIGTRLLQHERNSLSGGGGSQGRMNQGEQIPSIAKKYRGVDAEGKLADSDLRTRIIKHEMDQRAFALTLRRAALEAKGNAGPSAATSVMKNVGARITQDRAELAIEIMGMQGLGWEGEGFSNEELAATRTWLWGKAVSIYGGSTEIQNNVIAKRILGMLDHQ